MVVGLGLVTYLDRACIATLAPEIMGEFSLSKVQMGYVFSAFALAYAAFEIPTAIMADRLGTRRVLTRVVVWWSAFTAATGLTVGYNSLWITRFLFGAGEAGAWPCMGRTIARWIPQRERGRVQGLFFAGAHFAGGAAPLVVAYLLRSISWRAIFGCFGAVGLLWATIWGVWFRDNPEEHRSVDAAERNYIVATREKATFESTPKATLRQLLRSRAVLALAVMYFPNSFVSYFCMTWLPTFLKEKYGLVGHSLVIFSGLPLVLSVLGDLFGGVVTDRMTTRFGPRIGRCGVGGGAYLLAASALVLVPFCHSGMMAGSLIAIATAITMFSLPAAWSVCIDSGGSQPALTSAMMNTAGQIGSLVCPLVVAYSLRWFGSWNISFDVMAALFGIGVIAWWLIPPVEGELK